MAGSSRKLRESCSSSSCGKLLADKPTATCDDCQKKFHLQCTDITTEISEILAVQTFCNGLFYRCLECRAIPKSSPVGKSEFDKKMNEITEKLNSLNLEFCKRLENIENQNTTFPKEVKDSITNYAQVVSNNIKENIETKKYVSSMNESIKTLETNLNSKMDEKQTSLSVINEDLKTVKSNIERNSEREIETKLRAQKINNVCIFNIPELNSNDAEANYKHDVKILKTVFDDKIQLKKEDVKAMYRIGNEDARKPRPIIMKFSTIDTKFEILKLKDISYNDTKNEYQIFITPDRTRKEQSEHKELVKTLKERKLNGEDDIGIRNGKIVKIQPFRPDPQNIWG